MSKGFVLAFLLVSLSYKGYAQVDPVLKEDLLKMYRADTVEGFFLYELNVPYACYSRFDQVEQKALIIRYDSAMFYKDMKREYQKGVYIYLYSNKFSNAIDITKIKSVYNDSSVIALLKEVNYMQHAEDTAFLNTVVFDDSRRLMYKKIYMRLVCLEVGKIDCLIPDMTNYRCCYSNKKQKIDAKYIVDVLEFKIY